MNPIRNGLLAACLLLGLQAGGYAQASTPAGGAEARELGHGYAMLNTAFSHFRHLDWVLLLKQENAQVGKLIQRLASEAELLGDELEELAAAQPSIDLHNQGLPRFEAAKRKALIRSRGLELGTPLFGKTGRPMERQALLSLAAAINQQRFLIQVMLPAEGLPARKAWLEQAQAKLDQLHADFEALLEAQYFCP